MYDACLSGTTVYPGSYTAADLLVSDAAETT